MQHRSSSVLLFILGRRVIDAPLPSLSKCSRFRWAMGKVVGDEGGAKGGDGEGVGTAITDGNDGSNSGGGDESVGHEGGIDEGGTEENYGGGGGGRR